MYTITIELDNVAEGDAVDLAREIWEANAESFDAKLGEFRLKVDKDGFSVDWELEP
jgi:hypothetical protein